jgi:hypothetical protein
MSTLPDWLNYDTIVKALRELGGPYADEIGLSLLVILVLGILVRWVIQPLRGR